MRWSPRASIVPPRRPPVPRHREAVLGRLDVGAEAAQPLDDAGDAVGLLQAQLLRAAHDRLALGEAAEQRHQRQLVDRQRHLLGLDDGALERAVGDVEVADRLVRERARRARSSRSPSTIPRMRRRMRRKPVRVQLTPTSRISRREPGTSTPAAIRNAAELGSPGTRTLLEQQLVGVGDRDVACRCGGCRRPARSSIRSVWSRLRAGSPTVVAPSAASAASSTHDLTWALATGSS